MNAANVSGTASITAGTRQFGFIVNNATGLRIENCRFINCASVNVVSIGATSSDVVFNRNYVQFAPKAPPIFYDNSTLYFECDGYRITNSTFETTVGNGARAAIEVHRSTGICQNNSIKGFRQGINCVDSHSVNSPDYVEHNCSNNTIVDCVNAIYFWPSTHLHSNASAGTATAGGAASITLAAGSPTFDSYFRNWTLAITGGTGSGQSKTVLTHTGSTRVCLFSSNWATPPDATSTYMLTPLGGNASDDYYNNWVVEVLGGTGSGQVRKVSDYVGSTKVLTVPTWTVTPDTTSQLKVYRVAKGLNFNNNNIYVAQASHAAGPFEQSGSSAGLKGTCSGFAVAWNNDQQSAIEGMNVQGNVITFEEDAGQTFTAEYLCDGISVTPYGNYAATVNVTGNTIVRAPGPGIRTCGTAMGSRLLHARFADNQIRDAGQGAGFTNPAYRTGFSVENTMTDVVIEDNSIHDSGASALIGVNAFASYGV